MMTMATCPNCGAKNRVDEEQARHQQPVCGRCGARLDATESNGHPVEVTDQTLGDLLESAGSKPVLVDCWADWCGPCRMLGPILDQLAAESDGRFVIAKLDVDNNPRTAERFRVGGIPTMLIFKNGKLVDEMVGVTPKGKIAERLAKYV